MLNNNFLTNGEYTQHKVKLYSTYINKPIMILK